MHAGIEPSLIVRGHAYIPNLFDLATLGVSCPGDVVAFADDDDAKRRVQDALDAILKPY
jgi:hypothetical protein